MKKLFLSAAIAAAAMTFTSCNSEQEQITTTEDVASFSSAITRVSGTSWESGDQVGIVVTDGSDIIDNTIYKYNALYNVNESNGSFTADTDDDLFYYPVDGSSIHFYAYYPYSTQVNSTDMSYPINVEEQGTPANIDFMEASTKTTNGYSKSNSVVSLQFNRRMSKLTFTLEAGDGFELDEITAISLEGLYTTAVYDFPTNTFGTYGDIEDITPYDEGNNTYSVIIIPTHEADDTTNPTEVAGLYTAGKVKFETASGVDADETFYWDISADVFAAGTNNTYTVTVTRTGVQISGNTINAWNNGTSGTATAE